LDAALLAHAGNAQLRQAFDGQPAMATVKIVSGRTALQDKDRIERLNRAAQYIPVYAKLTDGTGNVSKTAYLHFELQNCGSNFPIVPGNSRVIVQTSFNLKPNQPDACATS
jgi:hypothetical protein